MPRPCRASFERKKEAAAGRKGLNSNTRPPI
jgi:hypothetical protein